MDFDGGDGLSGGNEVEGDLVGWFGIQLYFSNVMYAYTKNI